MPPTAHMDDQALDAAQSAIGHRFGDRGLLVRALRHASVADARVESNERLEFLGDAILGMIVCEEIYHRFPDLLEGEMTKIKSTVVSRKTCAEVAGQIGLAKLLTLGKGMRVHEVLPASLSAAALEAVAAALYLDAGLDAARRFLLPLFGPYIDRAEASGHQHNFKSVLQHHAQQSSSASPAYLILDETGPDHAKRFQIAVEVAGRRFEPAWGSSKKEAEQHAALNALRELGALEEIDGHVRVRTAGSDRAAPGQTPGDPQGPAADLPPAVGPPATAGLNRVGSAAPPAIEPDDLPHSRGNGSPLAAPESRDGSPHPADPSAPPAEGAAAS